MPEPVKSDKTLAEEAAKLVTPQVVIADTTQLAQPATPNAPAVNPTAEIEKKLNDALAKIETLSRQYSGSTEEALRLKDENKQLKQQVDSMKSGDLGDIDEKKFQELVDKVGLKGAIDSVLGPKVASLEKEIKSIVDRDAQNIFSAFEASHAGLKNLDVKKKFDEELGALRSVYSDINVAMEKAYVLAGGKEAEKAPAPQKVEDDTEDKLIKTVADNGKDSRPAPIQNSSDIQQKINELTYKANVLSSQGKTQSAMHLLAQADQLRGQLGSKV